MALLDNCSRVQETPHLFMELEGLSPYLQGPVTGSYTKADESSSHNRTPVWWRPIFNTIVSSSPRFSSKNCVSPPTHPFSVILSDLIRSIILCDYFIASRKSSRMLLGLPFDPEDGGSTFFRNIGNLYHTTQRHVVQECALQSQWQLQIWHLRTENFKLAPSVAHAINPLYSAT
jgi:hypothetical protein